MATEERVKHTFDNFIWGYISVAVTSIMPFIIRGLIIRCWGIEYLGINSLFASILNVLNISELGIGSAIIYSLYKPMAEKDTNMANKLLSLFRFVYRLLGGVIFVVGILLLPFLRYLIDGEIPGDINIYIVYLVYLINTVVSYWVFPQSTAVFQANQITSVNNKICSIVWLFNYLVQILIIIFGGNYYEYIMLLPVGSLLVYYSIGIKQRKSFPQYVPPIFKKEYFSKDFWLDFKKRLLGMSLSKLRITCRSSIDTIVVSSVLGLAMTAKYQNYLMVMTVPSMLALYITGAALPSLGNAVAVDSKENALGITKMLIFVVEWFSVLCGALLMCFYQPFMSIYVGKEGLLPLKTVILFVVYFYLKSLSSISDMVRNSCGIWWEGKWVAIFETIINLILNIILIKKMGVDGVIIATILSLILINIPLETYYIFKYYFHKSMWETLCEYIISCVVALLAIGITALSTNLTNGLGIFSFILKVMICISVPNIIFFMCYYKTSEMQELKKVLQELVTRKPK